MKASAYKFCGILPIVLGLALFGATLAGLVGPWGRVGVVPLATGLNNFCPLYTVLGFSICPVKN